MARVSFRFQKVFYRRKGFLFKSRLAGFHFPKRHIYGLAAGCGYVAFRINKQQMSDDAVAVKNILFSVSVAFGRAVGRHVMPLVNALNNMGVLMLAMSRWVREHSARMLLFSGVVLLLGIGLYYLTIHERVVTTRWEPVTAGNV